MLLGVAEVLHEPSGHDLYGFELLGRGRHHLAGDVVPDRPPLDGAGSGTPGVGAQPPLDARIDCVAAPMHQPPCTSPHAPAPMHQPRCAPSWSAGASTRAPQPGPRTG